MRYWMMRLFLTSRHVGLFAGISPDESREAYLRRVFSAEIVFQHRRRTFVYKPFDWGLPFITGVVGKQHTVNVGAPPQESFKRKGVEDWQTANVFIDPSGESDGQKVAVQNVRVVGQPLLVFRSLADQINAQNRNADWSIALNAITSQQEFWTAVQIYRGRISELQLNFVAPNIWGGTTETENALKKLNSQNRAQEVEVTLKNPDKQLEPDSDTIRQSVDYISKGGGSLSLKQDGKTTLFSSEQNVVTSTPAEDSQIEDGNVELLRRIAEDLLRRHDPAQRVREPDR